MIPKAKNIKLKPKILLLKYYYYYYYSLVIVIIIFDVLGSIDPEG